MIDEEGCNDQNTPLPCSKQLIRVHISILFIVHSHFRSWIDSLDTIPNQATAETADKWFWCEPKIWKMAEMNSELGFSLEIWNIAEMKSKLGKNEIQIRISLLARPWWWAAPLADDCFGA